MTATSTCRTTESSTFGVYPGAVKTVTSAKSYNDGKYHHIVANLGSDGMKLYVDGELVGSDASVTSAQGYNGYWRVGGDNLGSWTNQPTSAYFASTIDEVAVYAAPLTKDQVDAHWSLSGWGPPPPNVLPTAAFTSGANRLAATFDGTTSSDPDGTIASYAWDFGDGTTGTGATANHNYAAEGTYTVKLKVTDNSGGVSEVSHDITVTDPNALPTAAFTSSTTDLTASLNGSTSTDPDGTIASYEWDFGDGTTGSGATIDHAYAAAGTYDVKLTVTDNRGATAEVTHSVKVIAPSPALVMDDFDRILANGWGTSIKGGAWTGTGTASNFAVAGGVGSMTVPLGATRTQSSTR
jgi:PKD repeat protein